MAQKLGLPFQVPFCHSADFLAVDFDEGGRGVIDGGFGEVVGAVGGLAYDIQTDGVNLVLDDAEGFGLIVGGDSDDRGELDIEGVLVHVRLLSPAQ